jgi:CRP-like cAMP-binding protein
MSINAYQLLKGVGLSEQRVLRVLPSVRSQAFEVDALIWPKGATLQPWTHILSGLVCAGLPEQDGGFTPLNIYGSDTWFGGAAILNNQPSTLEYVCLTPVRVISLPFADTQEAFEAEPEFSRYLARLVTWRDQQHVDMLTLMRTGSPELRVVMGLALLAEALNCSSSHLPTSELDDSLEIPLKQSLLAAMCGVSRGVFSVCVQQLVEAGWLSVNYAAVNLMHIKTWGNFSHAHRHNRLNKSKQSMQDLLSLMKDASSADFHVLK